MMIVAEQRARPQGPRTAGVTMWLTSWLCGLLSWEECFATRLPGMQLRACTSQVTKIEHSTDVCEVIPCNEYV